VNHHLRRIENAYSTVERQVAMNEKPTKSRKCSTSNKVVIRDGEVLVDRSSILRAKSNSCSLRRRGSNSVQQRRNATIDNNRSHLQLRHSRDRLSSKHID